MVSCALGYATDVMPPGAVRALTPTGALLAARHEMRPPFAGWLAAQAAASVAHWGLSAGARLCRYAFSFEGVLLGTATDSY